MGGTAPAIEQATQQAPAQQDTQQHVTEQNAQVQQQYQQAPQQYQQQAPQSVPTQQAPVQQQQAPQQQQTVPTTPTSYTQDQLAVAAQHLMDQGKQNDLFGLLNQFGVQALTQLPQDQYGNFATKLRELGANL
ncbi:hypothetical protein [Oceanobacillus neutriphilus]|nr:hypothetical protein [Oceanobacillus neutriphilus]